MKSCISNQIFLLYGYWRENNQTDKIYKCLSLENCLGGLDNFSC